MKGELYAIIDQLEEITGRKFDYDKLREVMEISNETCYWWKKATEKAAAHPSPLDGFDIFNYMAIIVFARAPPRPGTSSTSGMTNWRRRSATTRAPGKTRRKSTGSCGTASPAGPTSATPTRP